MAHLFTNTPVSYTGTANPTIVADSSIAAGSLILLTVIQFYGANPPRTITGVTDTVNSGSHDVGSENVVSGNITIHQFYKIATSTGTPTFTVALSGTGDGNIGISVYDSTHTTIDDTNSATGTGTSFAPGAATPSGPALYVYAAGIGPQYDTFTLEATFNARTTYQGINGAVPFSLATGDFIGGTGAKNPTVTGSVSREWAASVMTFIGADTTPDGFAFTDQTGVAPSSVRTSNTLTVSGIGAAASISVSGAPGSEYQINGGSFTTAPGTISNGDTFAVRHTSSSGPGVATDTTLTIGGVSDTFTSTTAGAPVVVMGGRLSSFP